ncbi:MAG: NADPH-dependent F420 reductase [Nitrososphaerales archaeon]
MRQIGLVGGTGDIGSALAVHLAKKYERVLVGSRDISRSKESIGNILKEKPKVGKLADSLIAATNETVVSQCDIVLLTVPYASAIETIQKLEHNFRGDQLLISTVASLTKTAREFLPNVKSRSISKSIQDLLPTLRVSCAFQTLPASILYNAESVDADVFVCCDHQDTFQETAEVVTTVEGLRPLYAGTLDISTEVEGLTAILLNIAARNKLKSPTFKIRSF